MGSSSKASTPTDLHKLVMANARTCGKSMMLVQELVKSENPSKIKQLKEQVEDLSRRLDAATTLIAKLEAREDAMCDLHYANGAKQGFSWGQTDNNDALARCVESRVPAAVRELKVAAQKAGGERG